MNRKERLEDFAKTLEFQQKQEHTLYGGMLNQSATSRRSYQTWDGENLIEYFTPKGEPLKRLTKELYLK